jgi:hypothetical protein
MQPIAQIFPDIAVPIAGGIDATIFETPVGDSTSDDHFAGRDGHNRSQDDSSGLESDWKTTRFGKLVGNHNSVGARHARDYLGNPQLYQEETQKCLEKFFKVIQDSNFDHEIILKTGHDMDNMLNRQRLIMQAEMRSFEEMFRVSHILNHFGEVSAHIRYEDAVTSQTAEVVVLPTSELRNMCDLLRADLVGYWSVLDRDITIS